MSLYQYSVPTQMDTGQPGTIRVEEKYTSVVNTEVSAQMPFGIVVVQDKSSTYLADPQGCVLPTAAADTVLGIIGRSDLPDTWLGTTGVLPTYPVHVVQAGEVLVRTESAVVKGARAYCRILAYGSNTQLGSIRGDVDNNGSADTAFVLKGSYFMHSAAAGALVWLRFDDAANRAAQS